MIADPGGHGGPGRGDRGAAEDLQGGDGPVGGQGDAAGQVEALEARFRQRGGERLGFFGIAEGVQFEQAEPVGECVLGGRIVRGA
ncbi:MAG: hypothetical protein GWO11_01365 [Desulfuromonadales bacterium]|nr:hypothetical protein [Desulfuromonadales bacterium]NIR33149.1 hypothetical protein [Desulfuromonadales bacterium]NIS41933.1 hypothetical protein [Desulfuromonadales bacterium]